jgi:TorA maturation chaperone TorD
MNKESLESIQLLLETRIFAYDLLRRTFLEEPSKEFLGIITEKDFIESFPFMEENKEIREGVNKVVTFLEEYDLTSEEEYDSLHWDYTRMFIGPDK